MSWDGIMMRFPPGLALQDLPNDWQTPPLGSVSDIRIQLEKAFPRQRHIDGQTCIQGDSFWIEFNYRPRKGGSEVVSIGVRSNAGPGSMAVMQRACEVLDLRMMDCQTSEIADFSNETQASMEQFTDWRDRNLRKTSNKEG